MLVGAGERSSVPQADASRSPWSSAGARNLIPLALRTSENLIPQVLVNGACQASEQEKSDIEKKLKMSYEAKV